MHYCALLDFFASVQIKRMPGKKFIVLIWAIVVAMQTFALSPGQANNLFIQENNSSRNIILAEALVEYPFGWFYSLDKIDQIYEVEYYENKRLANFIRHENGKCINQCNDELSEIPGQFIETTLNMLKQMLDKKLTRYLFRLDTFHGHFFVTDEQFERNYLNLNSTEMMQKFIHDDSLGVLFHCAEHMALRNPPRTGPIDKEAQKLIEQRNIIAWYNTQSIKVVTPEKKELVGSGESNTATIPQGFHAVGFLTFKANINGEFSIKHAGNIIRLDISLCDYYYH
jgi:hypothetical protein